MLRSRLLKLLISFCFCWLGRLPEMYAQGGKKTLPAHPRPVSRTVFSYNNSLRDTFPAMRQPDTRKWPGESVHRPALHFPLPAAANAALSASNPRKFTVTGTITLPIATVNSFCGSYIGIADIFVPNAFTPNGDGHNDMLKAIPVRIREFKYFAIFNRWRQRIFFTAGKAVRIISASRRNPEPA